jgi:hypothetical protein
VGEITSRTPLSLSLEFFTASLCRYGDSIHNHGVWRQKHGYKDICDRSNPLG